jgi:hypothetical protein
LRGVKTAPKLKLAASQRKVNGANTDVRFQDLTTSQYILLDVVRAMISGRDLQACRIALGHLPAASGCPRLVRLSHDTATGRRHACWLMKFRRSAIMASGVRLKQRAAANQPASLRMHESARSRPLHYRDVQMQAHGRLNMFLKACAICGMRRSCSRIDRSRAETQRRFVCYAVTRESAKPDTC